MILKRLTVLLILVNGVAVIGPLGLQAKTQDKIQIHLFIQMSPSEKENPNSTAYQMVNQYNQSKENIELVLDITTAGCSFDAADTLLQRIEKGNPPDISFLRYRELWGHYLDLTPYLTGSFLSSMDTTMLHAFRIKSRQVFLPTGYSCRLFYYNKKMFDAAGLAYPPQQYGVPYADGEAWDVNKLEEIARLLTLDNQGHHAYEPEFDEDHIIQYGFHWGWLNGIGMVQMFGPAQIITENEEVILSDHTRQGYEWIYNAIREEYYAPDMTVFTNVMDGRPIRSEKCAMMLSYVDNARILQNTTIDWDIGAIPSCDGVYHVPWGIGGYAILETSPHPAEAMEVITDIINIQDLYATPDIVVPMKKDLHENMMNIWGRYYPHRNLQAILDGFDHRSAICDGEAVQFRMEAWRLVNAYRDYLWQDPDAQAAGAIDAWLIPAIEAILNTAVLENGTLNTQPGLFRLFQNYPNPFNPRTTIWYQLPENSHVAIGVYNICGKEITTLSDDVMPAGRHSVSFDATGLSGGVYFYQLRADGYVIETKKMLLMR